MIELQENVADLERKLEEAGVKAADLSDAWTEVGKWWKSRQQMVFITMNRGAWAPDKPTTKMGRGVLIKTGKLLRAASSERPLYSSPTTARFGMKPGGEAYYGLFHQQGAGVPKRQPIPPLTQQEGTQVVEIIAKHILGN